MNEAGNDAGFSFARLGEEVIRVQGPGPASFLALSNKSWPLPAVLRKPTLGKSKASQECDNKLFGWLARSNSVKGVKNG